MEVIALPPYKAYRGIISLAILVNSSATAIIRPVIPPAKNYARRFVTGRVGKMMTA
jgi:hypothetical protein